MLRNGLKHVPDANEAKRPNTTANNVERPTNRPFTVNTQIGGMTALGINKMNAGGRGLSANYAVLNPKLRRYENLIFRLKKILEAEKK